MNNSFMSFMIIESFWYVLVYLFIVTRKVRWSIILNTPVSSERQIRGKSQYNSGQIILHFCLLLESEYGVLFFIRIAMDHMKFLIN